MKKKGFTLIELLAVIVILAIVALITFAVVGNMISSAKIKSAEDSMYGYIESVDWLQTTLDIAGKDLLKKETYNVSKETIVNGKTVEPLNNLINMKGNKPTGGSVSINESGSVSSAILCFNHYLVEYIGGVATASEGCGEMDLLINYNIDNSDWSQTKTLTIEYPEGSYEYYLELKSGSAKLNDKEIAANEAIKVESPVDIVLTENSEISTWFMKGTKKISRTYIETKIDNVELNAPEIVTTSGYPKITTTGVVVNSDLILNWTDQDGTSAYYSIDNGTTWNKYTSKVDINSTNVKAKLVRDVSKMESKTVEKSISTATDALASTAYDGDKSTYFGTSSENVTKYLYVDKNMIGLNVLFDFYLETYGNINLMFYDKNNFMISKIEYKGYNKSGRQSEIVEIPSDCTKVGIEFMGNNTKIRYLYEIVSKATTGIVREAVYPTLSSTGFNTAYNNIKINYDNLDLEKMYKIESGEWIKYNDKAIKLNLGQTIYVKGISSDGVETAITSYKSALPVDSITSLAYDGKTTTGQVIKNANAVMNVDSSMWGKGVKIVADKCTGVYMYDNNYNYVYGKYFSSALNEVITIPYNTIKLKIHNYQCDNYSVKEVNPST